MQLVLLVKENKGEGVTGNICTKWFADILCQVLRDGVGIEEKKLVLHHPIPRCQVPGGVPRSRGES